MQAPPLGRAGPDRDRTSQAIAVEVPPVSGNHRYMPALDGLRALAVAGVICYHLEFHWAAGGFLGVDLFFVLSGFLITGLLCARSRGTGGVALGDFWGRRARRLLPAVLLLLVVLTLYDWLGGPNIDGATFRGDALATLFYSANWHLIVAHQSYFAQFQAPSPLRHTWSLAIEEQFYVVWPLVIMGLLYLHRRRRGDHGRPGFPRTLALVVTGSLALASALDMALVYRPGVDPSQLYYGTETRAFELLIGALLALLVVDRPEHPAPTRRLLHIAGPLCAVALGALFVTAGDGRGTPFPWMFRGGMVLAALLAAVVIASVAQPDAGPLGRALSLRPLRWIGAISYGLYLWHWPVYVLMTDVTTGLSGPALLAARLGATLAAATASFYLLERPVRRYRSKGWPLAVTALSAVGVTALAILLGTVPGVAEATPSPAATASVAAVRLPPPGGRPDRPPPPIDVPASQVISPASPLRVMTIGDSVMYDAEPGLAAALEATGEATVSTRGFPGWGLLNDPNFAGDLAHQVASVHPQLVIGMWSWDDAAARAHPAAYARLLRRAVDVLLAPGDGVDGVALMQFPLVGPLDGIIDPAQRQRQLAAANAGTRAWSRIAAALPAQYPGRVTFLTSADSLNVHGRYSPWLPTTGGGWVRARKTDNTHICPAGAAVLGAAVARDLRAILPLAPLEPGWINRSWTTDAQRYGVPAGGCPDDQPPG